ncbi:gp53-like domain-containing protein [Morganella morganii]
MFGLDNKSGINVMPPIAPADSQTPLWFTEGGAGLSATYPGQDWFNQIQAELLNVLKDAGVTPEKGKLNQLSLSVKALVKSSLPDAYTKTESDSRYQPKGSYQAAGDYATNTNLNAGLNTRLPLTGGILTGNDNVLTIRNTGANRANFIQGENNQGNAEWMMGRLGLGSDVSLYSAVHGLSLALRSDGAYVNNDKIMAGVASLLDDRGYIKFGDSGLILQWGLTPNPIGGESVDLSFPIPFPTKCLGGIVTPTGSSGDAGFLTSWFHILSRSGFRLTNARTGTTVKYSFYWFAWGK